MKFRAIAPHPSTSSTPTSSILLSQSITSSSTSSTSTSSILLSQSITSLSSPESTSTPPYQPTPVVLEQISNKYNCVLCGKWLKSKLH